jgi:cobalamin biosynthesis Mg chelatase CobN
LETARKYRAAELKKEKSTWSKAFKSSKAAHDADEAAAAAAAAAAPPSGPQSPVNGAARSSSHASSSGTHAASSSTVNVSKGGDKVHIDMNSILGKDTKSSDSDSLDVVAKRDDTFFNMVFGLGFLSVLGGGLFWMYRTRFLRR